MAGRYRVLAYRLGKYREARRGDVVELPDTDAERLVRIGAVVPVDAGAPASGDRAPAVPPALSIDDLALVDDEDQDDEPEPEPAPEPPAKRPAQVADKSEWIEYAVARGRDREYAESRTKRELIAELS